jgi:hypothetical protein
MYTKYDYQSGGIRRRTFLRRLGTVGVLASAPRLLGVHNAHAQDRRNRGTVRGDLFGRLFPNLRSFAEPRTESEAASLKAALLKLGKPGGILDAQDNLAAGPIALIVDPALSANNPNNPAHTAGTTFMGQFMDHDMTFDIASRLAVPTVPERAPNDRTPSLDLDSVYGLGPIADRELYVVYTGQAAKFKVESGGLFEDLPRTAEGDAIIADPRNDENLMIAGLHAACLLFHNKAVDLIASNSRRSSPGEIFESARQLTRWHYQWLILHEVLPLFIGQKLVDDILHRGRKFYRPEVAFIPVEFQGAAYRFGHTLVRPSYRANLAGDNGTPFFGMIFDPAGEGQADPVDLRGGARAPRRFIGWQTFFDFGPTFTDPGAITPAVRPNKLIDTKISTPLFHLPLGAIPGAELQPTALPQRNLLRHITWQLPSGQSIARHINVPALSAADLSELRQFGHNLDTSTPLWYYILKEAKVMGEGGRRLGPVGGRIVGEVLVGLLQLSSRSFLSVAPRWKPTLPTRSGGGTGDFRMVDFLTFAGVDPGSRRQ